MIDLTKTTQAGCRTITEAIGTYEIKRNGSISYFSGSTEQERTGAIYYVEVDFDDDWISHACDTYSVVWATSSPDKRILDDIRNAIEATFDSGNCGCSHDMCRCVSHSANAMQRWDDDWGSWIVVVNEQSNY